MFETREFRGWWWLPAQTENQLPGTLVVTRGEAELDLTGHFGHAVLAETDHEMVMSGHLAEQPRILGIDRNGKEVTSDGHQSASYSEHSAGVTISKYTRRITLVGKHFQAGEEIEFDEIAIRASDLTAWTQTRVIETKAKTRKRKRGHVWGDVSARSKTLPDIEITLARGERAFIRFGAKFKGLDIWGRGSEHAELTQDTAFHLRFGRARDLDYIFDRVGDLRNFLSLAVGRPVAILEVTGYRDDFADERRRRGSSRDTRRVAFDCSATRFGAGVTGLSRTSPRRSKARVGSVTTPTVLGGCSSLCPRCRRRSGVATNSTPAKCGTRTRSFHG